jgi:methylenetetrahydrofolate reductase (NADPH)
VSSLAVAHEVIRQGGRAIACINARDRDLLGFRRDLLTAAALGIRRLLLVYGDEPITGDRTSGLNVRAMLDEARSFRASVTDASESGFRVGVTCRLGRLPTWKRDADFVFAQVGSLADLLRWRDTLCFDGPVYAGVLVLPSAPMARRLVAAVPQIRIPGELVDELERDPLAGVDHACRLIGALRAAGGFAGVHLVPGVRSGAVAARLGIPESTEHSRATASAARSSGRWLTIPTNVIPWAT